MMKERPILFSAPMVQAILRGEKTQTRRIVKPQPDRILAQGLKDSNYGFETNVESMSCTWGPKWFQCPYGQPGDLLWVRETSIIAPKNFQGPDDEHLCSARDDDGEPRMVQYLASQPDTEAARWYGLKATPSIFMPRWASRITLEIVDVRVERLQSMSEIDARREGILEFTKDQQVFKYGLEGDTDWVNMPRSPVTAFQKLWQSINGEASWAANPWVWVVEFRRVQP